MQQLEETDYYLEKHIIPLEEEEKEKIVLSSMLAIANITLTEEEEPAPMTEEHMQVNSNYLTQMKKN